MKSSIFHLKDSIDFCRGRLFRLGMLCVQLSRVALRIIKTNYMYIYTLSIKSSKAKIYQMFSVVFWKINDFINTLWHYLTFVSHSLICSQMSTFAKYHAALVLLSRPVKVGTQAEVDVPGPVQRLEAKATTSFSILVSWSKAAKQLLNNKAMVTQYKLYYRQVIMVAKVYFLCTCSLLKRSLFWKHAIMGK